MITKEGRKNREKARQYFIDTGEGEKFENPVMHHILPCGRYYNLDRYNQGDTKDIVIMENAEHARYHRLYTTDYSSYNGDRTGLFGEKNGMYGVTRPQYVRDAVSIAHKGKVVITDGEHNKFIDKTDEIPIGGRLGATQKNRQDTSGEKNPMYGKIAVNSIPCIAFDLNNHIKMEFESVGKASKELGLPYGTLMRIVNGERKSNILNGYEISRKED